MTELKGKNSVRTGGDKRNYMTESILHYSLNGNINFSNNTALINKNYNK